MACCHKGLIAIHPLQQVLRCVALFECGSHKCSFCGMRIYFRYVYILIRGNTRKSLNTDQSFSVCRPPAYYTHVRIWVFPHIFSFFLWQLCASFEAVAYNYVRLHASLCNLHATCVQLACNSRATCMLVEIHTTYAIYARGRGSPSWFCSWATSFSISSAERRYARQRCSSVPPTFRKTMQARREALHMRRETRPDQARPGQTRPA